MRKNHYHSAYSRFPCRKSSGTFADLTASPAIRRCAFTLVELLVALFIVSLLAAIALPSVKNIINEQKGANTAQNVVAFFDIARNRAVAEGRQVGVRIERLNATAPFGRAASIRLRQLTGVPPYSGDAADAVARLEAPSMSSPIDRAVFSTTDCPLLLLSYQLLTNEDTSVTPTEYDTSDDYLSPIQIGDLLELPGGRTVPLMSNHGLNAPNSPKIAYDSITNEVTVQFDLTEGGVFPIAARPPTSTSGDRTKFRIHRSPVVSSTAVLNMPRGVAIDLNFSGIGLSGNNFAPSFGTGDVDIVFGPSGDVVGVRTAGSPLAPPNGLIYLCLGNTDGVIPSGEDLYQDDRVGKSNLIDLDSIWIVVNPSVGNVLAAPSASIQNTTIAAVSDRTDLSLAGPSLIQARDLARQMFSLESQP